MITKDEFWDTVEKFRNKDIWEMEAGVVGDEISNKINFIGFLMSLRVVK